MYKSTGAFTCCRDESLTKCIIIAFYFRNVDTTNYKLDDFINWDFQSK